jgi:hypothetical protein
MYMPSVIGMLVLMFTVFVLMQIIKAFGVILDSTPRVSDLGWLPGDDDIIPKRKCLKRLRLQKRKQKKLAGTYFTCFTLLYLLAVICIELLRCILRNNPSFPIHPSTQKLRLQFQPKKSKVQEGKKERKARDVSLLP